MPCLCSPAQATTSPAVVGNWRRLTDIQMRTIAANAGWGAGTATTATSTSPFITMFLDGAYDDIAGKLPFQQEQEGRYQNAWGWAN